MTAARRDDEAGGAAAAPGDDPTEPVEIDLHGFTHGGEAVGRLPDGTACFVPYAIPGERVRVRVVERRRRWARAELVAVVTPSPDRVTPPCPLFGPGRCGGCTLQHIAPRRQAELLGDVISDQLQRIGHLTVTTPVTVERPHGDDGLGYRRRARFAVDRDGHLAFRRAGSHSTIAVEACPLLTAAAQQVQRALARGWRGVHEVSLQVGTDGGAAMGLTPEKPRTRGGRGGRDRRRGRGRGRDRGRGRHAGHADPGAWAPTVPGETPAAQLGEDGARPLRGTPEVVYEVTGRRFEAHAASFFQASVAAAELLCALVRRMTPAASGSHVLELYAGVGLLSATLARAGARVTAVESHAEACRDAARNTADLDVTVVHAEAGPAVPVAGAVDAVVLDPPRTGADPAVLAWIGDLAPAAITYVSCDPATFARDARTLVGLGYHLDEVVGVDQFTHTGHVELVGAFRRTLP